MGLINRVGSAGLRLGMMIVLLGMAVGASNPIPAAAYAGGFALSFDGVDDAIKVGVSNQGQTIMAPDCKSLKSVTVWVRPLGATPSIPEVSYGKVIVGDGPNWFGIVRGMIGVNDRIWVYNFDNNVDQIGIPYTIGEWVHIALVHANGRLKAYKNGILIGDIASSTTNTLGDPSVGCTTLFIGGQGTGPRPYPDFQGHIDEVTFWGKELSAGEIRQIINSGLVGDEAGLGAYFTMSNGSGSTITDDSINDYHGTFYVDQYVTGSPAWVASGAMSGPDNALDFDGLDDSVDITNGSAALASQAAVTLSGWVYPRTPDAASLNYEGYFGVRNSTNADFYLTQEGTNIRGVFTNSAASSFSLSAPVTANAWQHLALVYNGSSLSLYKNGDLIGQTAANGQINNASETLFIGKLMDGATPYFLNGQVDEVRLWTVAQSAQQIREGMSQSLVGNEAGLAAYYRFDQVNAADQSILYDITGNNRDGSLTNMQANGDWVTSTAFNTWIGADSTDWSTGGNWSRNTAPAAGETAGIYTGSLVNAPSLGAVASMSNLVLASNTSLIVNSPGSLNTSGNIFNYGTLSQTQAVNAAPASFVATTGYGGVTIDPGVTNLGDVTVTFKDYQDCILGGGVGTVERCYNIVSTNPPSAATVTFFFDSSELGGNTCATLNGYHYSGSWVGLTLDGTYGTNGRECTTSPYSLRATGINSFSPFVLKSDAAPTAIRLEKFSGADRQSQANHLGLFLGLLLAAACLGLTLIVGRR